MSGPARSGAAPASSQAAQRQAQPRDEGRPGPVLSVLMPVHDGGRFLDAAVESILAQDFRDFEFLVIDDGSTDDSLARLQAYAAADDRLRIRSRGNQGLVATLNELLAWARGEFVARMDADDVAEPGRFRLQVEHLRRHPDVACVGGLWHVIDDADRFLIEFGHRLDDASIQRAALEGNSPICHPAATMRRSALVDVGGYRAESHPAEDLDLWLRLGEVGVLANLPDVVLRYRVHPASVSARRRQDQLVATHRVCAEARRRRGLPAGPPLALPAVTSDRAVQLEVVLRHGWWAFHGRQWPTAARYGLRALLRTPWSPDAWRLLTCALLRRKPAPDGDPPG